MDPAFTTATGFRPVMWAIYNNLVQLSSDGTIGPDLARTWEFSADGKTVTFHLAAGVKFQDGTTLDAQAIKWNYDRFLDPTVGAARRADLSPPLLRVEALDAQTVLFQLSAPFRPLLDTLTQQAGHMVSPTAVQKLNSYADRRGDFGRKPVGSGPFKFVEWVPDSHVTLVRNENYWEKGLPYLEAMKLPFIPDRSVQFAMLRTNEIDLVEQMRVDDAAIVEKNPNVRVIRQDGTIYRFMRFIISREPWNKQALRAAFAYAMDRDTLVKVMYQGLATPAYNPIGPVYGAWYDPTIKTYEYNTQKAKEKLTEAGYPKGFSYKQPCASSAFDIQWCETLQSMLSNVGISMQIQPWPTATYATDMYVGKHDGPLVSWISPRSDPHINIQRWFHSKGASNISGAQNYNNPEVDRLIEEAAGIYDVAKAKAVYNKALTIIAESAVQVFQVYEVNLYGIRDSVRGFATRSDREMRLQELWLSK